MNTLNDSDYAALKALHLAVRTALREAHTCGGDTHRYAILTSAFLRGRAYRRHERDHRSTTNMDGSLFEHRLPSAYALVEEIRRFVPSASEAAVAAWLADPSGAIPAPLQRAKKPYVGLGDAPVAGDLLPVAAE